MEQLNVYIIIGIIGFIYLLIYGIKIQYEIPEYKIGAVVGSYFVTRLLPFFMTGGYTGLVWINLFLELGILVFLYILVREDREQCKNVFMLYTFCPCTMLCVVSGSQYRMIGMFLVLCALIILRRGLKEEHNNFSMYVLYPEYVAGCVSGYIWFVATDVLNGMAKSIGLLGAAVILLSVIICGLRKMKAGRLCHVFKEKTEATATDEMWDGQKKEKRLSKKDILAMCLLTVTFLAIALYRLGNRFVPETGIIFSENSGNGKEIILEFEEETAISKLSLFLGYKSKRELTFSYWDEGNEEWVVFADDRLIETPFAWKDVDLHRQVSRISIHVENEDASLHEIVVRDEEGNIVCPQNMQQYPELFDEQDRYPQYYTYYEGVIFDEVYYTRTAYELLHGYPLFEITHPPLGKIIIAIGMTLFGTNLFGFRFMCVLCGTCMIPILYLFALKLTSKTKLAVVTTLLLCTEFMHFVLSRIATLDIIVALFVLLMFYFMFCFVDCLRKGAAFSKQCGFLILSGIAMGLSVATKWTGCYGVMGIAIWFFATLFIKFHGKWNLSETKVYLRKLLGICILSFVVIPAGIYILSYVPEVLAGEEKSFYGLIAHIIDNGWYMLNYHSTAAFEHSYSSEWYQWLINQMPLLDSLRDAGINQSSMIVTMLNPIVCFGGLAALIHNIYLWCCKRNHNAMLLVCGYMAMLAPWLFIQRTVFIYQYYICSLFLILLIGNSLYSMKKRQKMMTMGIAVLSTLFFVGFYPFISGCAMEYEVVNGVLRWIGL